jgi:hypothetical protein
MPKISFSYLFVCFLAWLRNLTSSYKLYNLVFFHNFFSIYYMLLMWLIFIEFICPHLYAMQEKKWSSPHTHLLMLCITLLWKPPQSVCLLNQCFSLTTAKWNLCKLGSFQTTSSRRWNYSHVPRYADFTSFQCDTIFIQDLGHAGSRKMKYLTILFF